MQSGQLMEATRYKHSMYSAVDFYQMLYLLGNLLNLNYAQPPDGVRMNRRKISKVVFI